MNSWRRNPIMSPAARRPPHVRLTYLIDNLLRAGTQTALLVLVDGLNERGYAQQVICLNDRFDPGMVAALEGTGSQVVIIGKRQLLTGGGVFRLYRTLRRSDILQTFLPASDLLGRALGRLARVPAVVTSIRARNIDKKPWQLWLDRRTMRWADRVVFNARGVVAFSQAAEGVRPEQVVVIPNGVRIPAPGRTDRGVLAGIVPPGVPLVGTVGRLRSQKGHAALLEAFAGVARKTAAHLLVIGEGELRIQLEAQARDLGLGSRVHFLGVRSDLPGMYAALDVYAHAAVFEGMPNAVMEAMAAGLPVVATEVDGTVDLIRDGETGWLVPAGDPDAMQTALLGALRDPERARRVGAAAARAMRENFSVEKMVREFDGLYRELLPKMHG